METMKTKIKKILRLFEVAGIRDDELIANILYILDKKESIKFITKLDKVMK